MNIFKMYIVCHIIRLYTQMFIKLVERRSQRLSSVDSIRCYYYAHIQCLDDDNDDE